MKNIRAAIDLGTNTALLLIIEISSSGEEEVVEDRSTVVRLGKGVDQTKLLDPEAMERTLECLKGYSETVKARGLHPSEVVAVTTATARDAKNGSEFFQQVLAETGFRFRTLTGEEEARASFLGGLLPGMNVEESVVFDLGGGSLEFQTANAAGVSLQLGSVRFTERFLKSDPVTDAEFWACREAVEETLAPIVERFRANEKSRSQLVGVAGTVVTLGSIHLGLKKFDRAALDGLTLTRGDLHRLVEEL
jgi:exopolyphosphatase/guanosine-5'-triphosphate,3'-diphosphate pyrophosphatase